MHSVQRAHPAVHNREPLGALDVEQLRQVAAKLRIRVSGRAKKPFVDALAVGVGAHAFDLQKVLKKKGGFQSWLNTLNLPWH